MNTPIVIPLGQLQQSQESSEIPPARVLAALRFLNDLNLKQMARAYPAGDVHGVEIVDGMKLEGCEIKAQEAACAMLKSYFDGKMSLDWRDTIQQEAMKKDLKADDGLYITCPARCCMSGPDVDCRLCRGSGYCVVSPGMRGKR